MACRYKTIKVNGKTKLLHRHIVEQRLGRALRPDEHVHHKNGDRYDNQIENLEVLSPKAHMHHHKQKHPETKSCEWCGTVFTPHPTKRERAKCCSQECARKLAWARRKGECPPLAAAIISANLLGETFAGRELVA